MTGVRRYTRTGNTGTRCAFIDPVNSIAENPGGAGVNMTHHCNLQILCFRQTLTQFCIVQRHTPNRSNNSSHKTICGFPLYKGIYFYEARHSKIFDNILAD